MVTAVLLDLTLSPNRSLGRKPARWLLIGLAVVLGLGGVRLLVLGLWPVVPFLLADLALMVWALHASFRSGRGHERLVLDDHALVVTRVAADGGTRETRLDALFTRVLIRETPLGDAHLFLATRGANVRIGACLSAAERRAVGAEVAAALARYRALPGLPNPSTSAIA
jgi:uncharacterized membrane protein